MIEKQKKKGNNNDANIKVFINNRDKNKQFNFPLNSVKTSKYEWFNFFPKCLILQFMRAANIYFLFLAILQSIQIISPLASYSTIGPLILVLLVSMTREGIEDYKRHRNDDATNEQNTLVYNNKKFIKIKWKDLQYGDIVKVCKDESFPADLFLITSNDENGQCYVETANLDGERNLKVKSSLERVHQIAQKAPLRQINGHFIAEKPNNNIHNFKGLLQIENQQSPQKINNSNILLRGTILKNTKWIIGLIIYAGQDTKVMKNQDEIRHKSTHIEIKMNRLIYWLFLFQTIISSYLAYESSVFQYFSYIEFNGQVNYSYLQSQAEKTKEQILSPSTQGIINYFSFFILLQTFIPISIIISLETVKLLQSAFIEFDDQMIYQEDKQPMKVLNTLIHEELGKVEYIFSDKTGTLTSNNMVFKGCCIGKIQYSTPELQKICESNTDQILFNKEYSDFFTFLLCIAVCHDVMLNENFNEKNKNKNKMYQGSSPDEVCLVEMANELNFTFQKRTQNAIFIKIKEKKLLYKYLNKIDFTSERKKMSIIIQNPVNNEIILFSKGADSVILNSLNKNNPANNIQLIKDSLKNFSQQGLRTLCLGKRVLTVEEYEAWNQKYSEAINEQDKKLEDTTNNNKANVQIDQSELIKQLQDEIEGDLELLGVTALEDKLQEGVPETLADLQRAGIKCWMLTGDKLETAENIGYLCNLLDRETKIFRIRSKQKEEIYEQLRKIRNRILHFKSMVQETDNQLLQQQQTPQQQQFHKNLNSELQIKESNMPISQKESQSYKNNRNTQINLKNKEIEIGDQQEQVSNYNEKISCEFSIDQTSNHAKQNKNKHYQKFALIIEGETLPNLFHDKNNLDLFLEIIIQCVTVICCRTSPKQKAEVVHIVKTYLKQVTLAIGDGGNDVNMIQEANIGIGIIGKEGNQAALASDYYFGQFRFLWRLLFVHGRWNLYRTSYFVKFFFFKNIVFTMQQFWFGIFSGYSSQTFWEDGYLMNYNSLVTAVAPIYYGVFDQDINPKDLKQIKKLLPIIYKEFKAKELIGYKSFMIWFLGGIVFSVQIYFLTQYVVSKSLINSDGFTNEMWSRSMSAYFATVICVWMVQFIDTNQWTYLTLFSYGPGSVLIFLIFNYVWNTLPSQIQFNYEDFVGNLNFWFTVVLNSGISFILIYVPRVVQQLFRPTKVQILQKKIKQKKLQITGEDFEIIDENYQLSNDSDDKEYDQQHKIKIEEIQIDYNLDDCQGIISGNNQNQEQNIPNEENKQIHQLENNQKQIENKQNQLENNQNSLENNQKQIENKQNQLENKQNQQEFKQSQIEIEQKFQQKNNHNIIVQLSKIDLGDNKNINNNNQDQADLFQAFDNQEILDEQCKQIKIPKLTFNETPFQNKNNEDQQSGQVNKN